MRKHSHLAILYLFLTYWFCQCWTTAFLQAQDRLQEQLKDRYPTPDENQASSPLVGGELESAVPLLQQAMQRLQQAQYRVAVSVTDKYLQLYPNHYRVAEANFYRAIASYHLGQIQQARNSFNAILTASPNRARRFGVFYWLGLIAYRLGEFDTAYDIWLRQLAIDEADAADYRQSSYLGLAEVMNQRGEPQEALRYYRLLQGHIKRKAGFAHGSLALRRGLYHEAYNAFSSYLILQETAGGPSRAQALFYQGQAAFFAGLLPQAKQSLDIVLRLYNSRERLFLAALIMRLAIALQQQDRENARRFYDEAIALEGRYRHSMKDWLNALELPLFMLQGYYHLAFRHMRSRLAKSQGPAEREIARFNLALAQAFLDVRYATKQLQKLTKSFMPSIRERALFHAARLQVSFSLTRSKGLAEMENYLKQYPEGIYTKQAVRILLTIYRSNPERFWLTASVLLGKLVLGSLTADSLADAKLNSGSLAAAPPSQFWLSQERARFYLYWAEMARQLKNTGAALKYLYQSWALAPRALVGLQAYYRSGAIYFDQTQYSRALGYFREVQLQLKGLLGRLRGPSASQSPKKNSRAPAAARPQILTPTLAQIVNEAEELGFYTELAIAQAYAGAGENHQSLRHFQKLILKSRAVPKNRGGGGNIQQARLQLGLVYFYQKAYDQAVTTFDTIISAGALPSNRPDIPPNQYPPALLALYWKGETLFRQGLFAAARQSFRQVSELYPEALGANAYLRAALAAKAAEDYNSVIEDLQRAQSLVSSQNLLQLLNIDFNLIKYNLLLARDEAAIEAAKHMLRAVPPAYNFLGEAFLEVAELYFNQGDLKRSQAILKMLEGQFIRRLPAREDPRNKKLELYLQKQNQSAPYVSNILTGNDLTANLAAGLFSFDAEKFLRRYSSTKTLPQSSSVTALDDNLNFYVQNNASQENDAISSSIFSALYLLAIIYVEQQNPWEASDYFLKYLKKDPLGPYALAAVNSVLRLLPELNTRYQRKLYVLLRRARLGDALTSMLLVRYWSLQSENAAKKRALEKIIRQTLSVNARKEAMYHLSVYYRKKGNAQRAQQLLLELRNIAGGNLALDPQNYWVGLANLELGRTAYRAGQILEAKAFLQAITEQAQVERETLAEALYWLAGIAHFEGDQREALRYRESLQKLSPNSPWLRKLNAPTNR